MKERYRGRAVGGWGGGTGAARRGGWGGASAAAAGQLRSIRAS